MPKMPWPPNPDELNDDYLPLRETLMLFFKRLLIGNNKETSRLKNVSQSLSQDCVYAVSAGTLVPAKPILLPWGIK